MPVMDDKNVKILWTHEVARLIIAKGFEGAHEYLKSIGYTDENATQAIENARRSLSDG